MANRLAALLSLVRACFRETVSTATDFALSPRLLRQQRRSRPSQIDGPRDAVRHRYGDPCALSGGPGCGRWRRRRRIPPIGRGANWTTSSPMTPDWSCVIGRRCRCRSRITDPWRSTSSGTDCISCVQFQNLCRQAAFIDLQDVIDTAKLLVQRAEQRAPQRPRRHRFDQFATRSTRWTAARGRDP